MNKISQKKIKITVYCIIYEMIVLCLNSSRVVTEYTLTLDSSFINLKLFEYYTGTNQYCNHLTSLTVDWYVYQ